MITKKCPKCNKTKSINSFYGDSGRRDKHHPHCKLCCRTYAKQYNKDSEYANKRRESYRINKIKAIDYLGNECINCGISFNENNACIFQFHHRKPEEKEIAMTLIFSFTWKRILKELDKCNLLCANCHFLTHNTL